MKRIVIYFCLLLPIISCGQSKKYLADRTLELCQYIPDHNYDAISSVADNLFVIADGYTNQVHCREDLVRHGYLRAEG